MNNESIILFPLANPLWLVGLWFQHSAHVFLNSLWFRVDPCIPLENFAVENAIRISELNKLMDEVDWLPNSLAKLSSLTTLNLGALELNTAANQISYIMNASSL
ncbi:hypothetical protein KSP40_PGU019558 [Platanthera guangdongensis]|uniref:Uncharacterized protein n=1 Tax=Platanthera guangdongensis TaxID=2320717 RepID=A0ABR2N0D8_9ASPA